MSDWEVYRRADTLRPGDRFIFADMLGGQGEILTVITTYTFGSTTIWTEELDFEIDVLSSWMVQVVEEEEV